MWLGKGLHFVCFLNKLLIFWLRSKATVDPFEKCHLAVDPFWFYCISIWVNATYSGCFPWMMHLMTKVFEVSKIRVRVAELSKSTRGIQKPQPAYTMATKVILILSKRWIVKVGVDGSIKKIRSKKKV